MDFETSVKLALYETIAETATVPTAADIAGRMGRPPSDIEVAFQALASKRLLVFEPGSTSRLRMAPPFSGIETAFPVRAGEKTFYANCVWDAFGVAAALHADVVIPASDGHTREPLTMEIGNGEPVHEEFVAHFAVPAAQWWDDIVFT